MNVNRVLLFLSCFLVSSSLCEAGDLSYPRPVVFHGKHFHEPHDLSAVALVGKYLVVGSDEGHVLQILEQTGRDTYKLRHKYSLPDGEETDRTDKKPPELDIEGIAAVGSTIYIVGSHSQRRQKVDVRNSKRRSHDENIARLIGDDTVEPEEEARRVLYKVSIDSEGRIAGKVERADLFAAIDSFAHLKPFINIPSKENGIDIEGIAARGDELFIGFRGPVLTNNWVPVLVTKFENPVKYAELRYINLGGLGIRDIVAADDGQFYLIAGPVGDGPGGFHLYSWNGLDCVPDKDQTDGVVQYLGEISTDSGAKAEGITILPGDQSVGIRLLVLFDGPEGGNPISLTLRR